MKYDILIDIGNTFAKVAFVMEGKIIEEKSVVSTDLSIFLNDIFETRGKAGVIAVSDVRKNVEILGRPAEECCEKFIKLDSGSSMPLKIDYNTPETLGADRIAAAIGAHAIFPNDNCLIFDFGTAITVDIVNSNGVYEGGNISPGMDMRFRAMHEFTGKLPLIEAVDIKGIIGKNTEEAINNGVVLGIIFEIERYKENYPEHKIIFTGGDAIFFAKKLKFTIFVVYNLFLRGLMKVAEF